MRAVAVMAVALCAAVPARAERVDEDDKSTGRAAPRKREGWAVLPGIYYSPDTGPSASAAALRYMQLGGETGRTSRVIGSVNLSLDGDVWARVAPDLWLDRDRYHIYGFARVARLDEVFFGIGNDASLDDQERYERLEVSLRSEAYYQVAPDLYFGGLIDVRYTDTLSVEEGGLLASGAVRGASGGWLSGVGARLTWDTRDDTLNPRSGGRALISPYLYHSAFGSDWSFGRVWIDGRYFYPLPRDRVLAVHGMAVLNTDDPPFDLMAMAGGPMILRGMNYGRFRDRHFAAAQVEYRTPVWWRFGAVAFAGTGRVAHTLGEFSFDDLKYSLGGGLRLALTADHRINARLDVGFTNDQSGLYIDILESF